MNDCMLEYKTKEEFEENFLESMVNKCNGCSNFSYEDGIVTCTKFTDYNED